jgi:hypothetical protein
MPRKVASNPFAAMRALERTDEVDGSLTAKDQANDRQGQEGSNLRPMFILPEGTRVQVNIDAQQFPKPEINVTTEKDK